METLQMYTIFFHPPGGEGEGFGLRSKIAQWFMYCLLLYIYDGTDINTFLRVGIGKNWGERHSSRQYWYIYLSTGVYGNRMIQRYRKC